jgi:F-type H+-transporting ATPase subunit delta
MRGTSSTSFAEVLRQAEAAFAADGAALETEAQELFSVADAIDSSNQLVRTLSDAGRPAAVRESTVRSLFGGRVGPRALELLGVSALLRQAQTEGVLEQVESEQFEVARLIDGSGELTAALDDARENPSQRAALLTRLLEGRTHRLTVALAARAVGRRTETKPARRIEEFARFASDRRRRAFATVHSAVPLSETQQARLGAVLASIYGREVQMNLQQDPEVVGGLRIQVGDDLYDATVLARLSRARSSLVA